MSDDVIWFAATAVATGAIARLSKRFPQMPKGLVPWLALLVGYALTMAKLAAVDGMSIKGAAAAAWYGLGAGMVAVGGHEALKPALGVAIGEDRAARVLGKLPANVTKPGKHGAALLVLLAALASTMASGCSGAMGAVVAAAKAASWLVQTIDAASDGASRYFARHPNEQREQEIADAVSRARSAAVALENGASAASRRDALAAYVHLRELLVDIMAATPPDGGAETEAPKPVPFSLPTEDEARAKVGA